MLRSLLKCVECGYHIGDNDKWEECKCGGILCIECFEDEDLRIIHRFGLHSSDRGKSEYEL